MPRVLIVPDKGRVPLLDEYVCSEHLLDRHAAEQLLERLRWAVEDAAAEHQPAASFFAW